MNAHPLLVEQLGKGYRRGPVLRDVSFQLRPGEAMAVVGPNGAGKSTLLGCLSGERLPDRGTIRICGADLFSDPRRVAKCMGYVPEQPFLYGELTVMEMLEFVVAARDLGTQGIGEARRLLSLLQLEGAEDLLCRELSQGMGRKVALTAALLHDPWLVVLDEALNGLDRPSVQRLLEELAQRRRRGVAVLLSHHDLSLVAEWCDRALLLAPAAGWSLLEGAEWERWRSSPSLRREGRDG